MTFLDAQQLERQGARGEGRLTVLRLVDDQLDDTDELLARVPA